MGQVMGTGAFWPGALHTIEVLSCYPGACVTALRPSEGWVLVVCVFWWARHRLFPQRLRSGGSGGLWVLLGGSSVFLHGDASSD